MLTFGFNVHSPKTKLSGLKSCPNGPERTESIVPGSKSTKMARGTNLLPVNTWTVGIASSNRGKKAVSKSVKNIVTLACSGLTNSNIRKIKQKKKKSLPGVKK